MQHSTIPTKRFLARTAAAVLFLAACQPLFADQTVYYWANTNGGNWTASANWVMEDGSAATTYPHVAGDVAVFNGVGAWKTVSVSGTIDVDELRLEDGCLRFGIGNAAHFHVNRFVRNEFATFYLVNANGYNWASPSDTVFGNRDEVLYNEGLIPGALVSKDNNNWTDLRSATLDDTGKLKFQPSFESVQSGYGVGSDTTWNKLGTLLYGNFASGRNLSFSKECVLTVPCRQISPVNPGCHVTASSGVQGTIATLGEPLLFWPNASATYFLAKVDAPAFVSSGFGLALLCGDHSSETNVYAVPAGTLQLGSTTLASPMNDCKLGTGPVVVSWSGTLDVGAEDAMKNSEYLKMTSFRGLGETYGKINLSTNSVVDWFWLDDKPQKRGTYGATGSGATFVDDALFSGPGLLTVKKELGGTLMLIY